MVFVPDGISGIEVGFPAASDTWLSLCAPLIEHNLIPPQVIQVLTPASKTQSAGPCSRFPAANRQSSTCTNPTSRVQRSSVFENEGKKSSKLLFRQFELSKSAAKSGRSSWEHTPEALLPPSRILRWKSAMRWWRNGRIAAAGHPSTWHPLLPFAAARLCQSGEVYRYPSAPSGAGHSFRCTHNTAAAVARQSWDYSWRAAGGRDLVWQ